MHIETEAISRSLQAQQRIPCRTSVSSPANISSSLAGGEDLVWSAAWHPTHELRIKRTSHPTYTSVGTADLRCSVCNARRYTMAILEDAVKLKEQGNKAFKEHDWLAAISFYTQAIDLNNREASFYTNRAQVSTSCCSCPFRAGSLRFIPGLTASRLEATSGGLRNSCHSAVQPQRAAYSRIKDHILQLQRNLVELTDSSSFPFVASTDSRPVTVC
jgi:hypothetical protein